MILSGFFTSEAEETLLLYKFNDLNACLLNKGCIDRLSGNIITNNEKFVAVWFRSKSTKQNKEKNVGKQDSSISKSTDENFMYL